MLGGSSERLRILAYLNRQVTESRNDARRAEDLSDCARSFPIHALLPLPNGLGAQLPGPLTASEPATKHRR